jgi:probable biosynthetic protein (TIGR04098 family)
LISTIESILGAEIANYTPDHDDYTFEALGLDSFDLVNLRSAIEVGTGRSIDDSDWVECRRPADLKRHFTGPIASKHSPKASIATRRYKIGMPQMAVGGLSENWLFKEVGDFHWSLISAGLGVDSSLMIDGKGNRLYATFTRFRIETSAPLSEFEENGELKISGSLARYGSGQFLGHFEGTSGKKRLSATVLSSFSARSSEASNSDLRKGQPQIPDNCPIPNLPEKPSFIKEYQKQRADRLEKQDILFSRDYEINPYTDINGVGLLYFAAYPTISDMCELSHFGREWATEASTMLREISYFANSDLNETLRFELLSAEQEGANVSVRSTLSKADGTPMASIFTRKFRSGRAVR